MKADMNRITTQKTDKTLRQRAVGAGVWSITSYAATQIIRLVSSLIMTRLLVPGDFGLMALVWAYITGINMFSDLGLFAYLFQSSRAHDREFANTIWSLNLIRSGIVTLIGVAIAYPIALLYGQPSLFSMLEVASLGLLLSPLVSTKHTLASRELMQKELAKLELTAQVISTLATIAYAMWFRSVWALVIGGLVQTSCRAIGSQFYLPGPCNRW